MKAFTHKLSDPLPELHDHHIFEEREARREQQEQQGERAFDGEDAEEWMRRSDEQGE
jgi:hypothetical protein